ncbi:bifunctional oligoribonuclease/PAP phosphatase NrnA [Natronolimnohabitans sp. A-GB9]|uniref:DHH family phosphoesterase n=1 Tax=Natronolimnohabitans sp. A-GB9 TaxID=3069757 RepID=UPI0027B183EA|nr:bifunctional oligoribonuclease/PAP phosphatase NrnA [Natronolimnohabitans sp. A-GB9]MDQ2052245.1 bifunctional oligoribonuclease/PAP phosphatase NrnA [Natronolimnohabitans sp. A-GB9]
MSSAEALLDRLRSASTLTIVCHDDPDPDSIASAIALELFAKRSGAETVDIRHGGTVSPGQNRAFVDVFDVELRRYVDDVHERDGLLAFVDHSVPGEHNPVQEGTDLDIVIDHHPPDRRVTAEFTDIREEYGATATILAEYFRESDVEPTARITTGLLFAIHRERLDFYRQPTDAEYDLANYLHARADATLLRKLYSESFTPATVDAFGVAIVNRVRRGSRIVSCMGWLENQVAIAQAADFLLTIDGVDTVLVCGIVRDEVHASARTIRTDLDLGTCLERGFGDAGSAGGHPSMAGGQIPLEEVVDADIDGDELVDQLRRRMEDRFFDAIPNDSGGTAG